MELQFPQKTVSCLRQLKTEIQTIEETQELRMPEEMPDIGSVLNAWGQVLLRGKQWRDGYMIVSGGVMVWILYLPEGEHQSPQTAQAWIPFQVKFDLPETKRDGTIRVAPLLRNVDARSTSARKMVARVSVSVLAQAYLPDEIPVSNADDLPEDIQLRKHSYPMRLPKETGEKEFSVDEELTLPSSAPRIAKLVRFSLHPEVIDKKVLSGKVVFRGMGLLHILYMNDEEQMCTWDFEIPFSQYAELDTDYEQSADTNVLPVVTGMELELDGADKLRLKAAITGQYMIYDVQMIEVASDAYSTLRDVEMEKVELKIPSVLEQKQQTVNAEQTLPQSADKMIDVAFYPDHPLVHQTAETRGAEMSGVFHVLYLDDQGKLCGTVSRWNNQVVFPAANDIRIEMSVRPSGIVQGAAAPTEMTLRADCYLESMTVSAGSIPMITGLNVGQIQQPDANRPCLIIRRKGSGSMWELAKCCGSTVAAIERANHLTEEAEDNRILLIPVR